MWGRRGVLGRAGAGVALVVTSTLGSCNSEPQTMEPTEDHTTILDLEPSGGLADPLAPEAGDDRYDVVRYEWDLEVDPSQPTARVAVTVTGSTTRATDTLSLDYAGPPLDRVLLDGKAAAYEETGAKLVVAAAFSAGQEFVLEASYEGEPGARTDDGMGGTGWIRRRGLVHTVHLLPGDAASWVPVNDTPMDPAMYRITLTVPDGYVGTASGREVVTDALEAGATRSVWAVEQPVTEVGFAVGRFERAPLPGLGRLETDVAAGPGDRLVPDDLALVPDMLEFIEGWFGPFPFPALGFTWTGHPSYLGDSTPARIHLSSTTESVLVHELAHQWIGGVVGIASTRDSWLREGLPTYVELLWAERRSGTDAFEQGIATYRQRLGEATRPLLEVEEPGDHADDVAYLRGALAVHALRLQMGDEVFRGWLREVIERGRGSFIGTVDVVTMAEERLGRDLTDWRRMWLEEPAVPNGGPDGI